jgi:DNA-binding XRE family transcriptional regulator
MAEARRRLGLTQQEMATAIGVTDRTIQNWETGQNLSQIEKKTEKLRRLLRLMDEFVVVPKEREWLLTKLPALGGKTPKEVILAGKMDDLILELSRLEEGIPV